MQKRNVACMPSSHIYIGHSPKRQPCGVWSFKKEGLYIFTCYVSLWIIGHKRLYKRRGKELRVKVHPAWIFGWFVAGRAS